MVLYSIIQLSPRRFQLYRLIVTCHDHKCLRCHLFSCDRLHALGITSKESTSILCLVKHITFYCSFQNKSPRIFYCRPSCILSFIANNVSNKHTCSSCEYWKKVAVKATTWSMQQPELRFQKVFRWNTFSAGWKTSQARKGQEPTYK